MKKIILLLSVPFLGFYGIAQTSLYAKTEIEFQGIFAIMGKTTTKMYISGDQSKTESLSMGGRVRQLNYFDGDKVSIIYSEPGELICAEGTKEELAEMNSKKAQGEYSDVVVEKTNKTDKILGFECKNAIIKYKQKAAGTNSSCENNVWYTEQLPQNSQMASANAAELGIKNELTDAMASLNGTILSQESKINGVSMMSIKIVELNKNEIKPSEFLVENKKCKKTLTMQEYEKKLKEKETKHMVTPH